MLHNKSLLVIYFAYLFNFIFKILAALDLHCGAWSLPQCAGFSSCGLWAPESVASVVVAYGLIHPVTCGILASGPGIEPASLTLEGRFLTTGQPGKSPDYLF